MLALAVPHIHLRREGRTPMTTTYGFDFARPRSRGARIARIDALATLLDTAFVIPGTGIRFGLDGRDVRYWHLAHISTEPPNVRFRG
jgi:hypothetical protein